MGFSLFTATSRTWLLRNRILPEEGTDERGGLGASPATRGRATAPSRKVSRQGSIPGSNLSAVPVAELCNPIMSPVEEFQHWRGSHSSCVVWLQSPIATRQTGRHARRRCEGQIRSCPQSKLHRNKHTAGQAAEGHGAKAITGAWHLLQLDAAGIKFAQEMLHTANNYRRHSSSLKPQRLPPKSRLWEPPKGDHSGSGGRGSFSDFILQITQEVLVPF